MRRLLPPTPEPDGGATVTADPQQVQERDGNLIVVTPCACRYEVTLRPAQARQARWQTCPGCGQRWLLYVLGSGRALWAEICADTGPVRPRRGLRRLWRWSR